MLCLLGCLVFQIEWGQVMEAMCIYCMSLQTFPIAHHPSIVPLLQFHSVGCEASRFQFFFVREGLANLPFKCFPYRYGSFLSIHEVFSIL
jgi:hypothetical protein